MASVLIEDLQREEAAIKGCKLCTYIVRMPDNEAEAVEDALASDVQHVKIAAILTKNGYPITEASVRRHRSNHA